MIGLTEMNHFITALITIVILIILTAPAMAIPPPTVVVNVGATLLELLGILLSFIVQFFLIALGFKKPKNPRRFWSYAGTVIVGLLIIGLTAGYLNASFLLKREKFDNLARNLARVPSDFDFINELKTEGELPEGFDPNIYEKSSLQVNLSEVYDHLFDDNSIFVDLRRPNEYLSVTLPNSVNVQPVQVLDFLEKNRGRRLYFFENGHLLSTFYAAMAHNLGFEAYSIRGGLRQLAAHGRGFFLYTSDNRNVTYLPRFFETKTSRQIISPAVRLTRQDLQKHHRKVQQFKNVYRLWSTSQVRQLLYSRRFKFVEMRKKTRIHRDALFVSPYQMSRNEIIDRFRTIDKSLPVIVICDDLDSSFEALWLGSILSDMGLDYQGRYPNPNEFYTVPFRGKVGYGPRERLSDRMDQGIRYLESQLSLVTGMPFENSRWLAFITFFTFILFLRILIFPLSAYSHFCKFHCISKLKDLAGKGMIADGGITNRFFIIENYCPRSVIIKLLSLLPDLIILIAAIMTGFQLNSREYFLAPWISDATRPWILLGLPLGLVFLNVEAKSPLYAHIGKDKKNFQIPTVPLLGAGLMAIMGSFIFPAVFSAFLLINYILVSIEEIAVSSAIRIWHHRTDRNQTPSSREIQKHVLPQGLLCLSDEIDPVSCGEKSANLSRLIRAGFPVPQGFVITDSLFKGEAHMISQELETAIYQAWDSLGLNKAAVRSSAVGEDTPGNSRAGMYTSKVNASRKELIDNIKAVRNSYGSDTAGGVIIQEYMEADYWGVLFTRDPNDPEIISLDLYAGSPGSTPMDRSVPVNIIIGRRSGKILRGEIPEKLAGESGLDRLAAIGLEIEQATGSPQDIEWAYIRRNFVILQTRTIQYCPGNTDLDLMDEKKRILGSIPQGELPVWVAEPLDELLPFPTPVSFSILKKIWTADGPTREACRRLLIPRQVIRHRGEPETLFNWLYLRFKDEEPLSQKSFWTFLSNFIMDFWKDRIHKRPRLWMADSPEDAGTSPAIPDNRRSLIQDLSCRVNRLVHVHMVDVIQVGLVIDFLMNQLDDELAGTGLDPAKLLVSPDRCQTFTTRCYRDREDYLKTNSHRAVYDFELSLPRFGESTPGSQISESIKDPRDEPLPDLSCEDADLTMVDENKRNKIDKLLNLLNSYLTLKEQGRDISARHLSTIRRRLLQISSLMHLGDGIFYLTIDEIFSLEQGVVNWDTHRMIRKRKTQRDKFSKLRLPRRITLLDLEGITKNRWTSPSISNEAPLIKGIRVHGRNQIRGTALIVDSIEALENLSPPDKEHIIIAPRATPALSFYFGQCSGMVTGGGGLLSHLSILARELKFDFIAGCPGITKQVKPGDTIIMEPDGTVRIERK